MFYDNAEINSISIRKPNKYDGVAQNRSRQPKHRIQFQHACMTERRQGYLALSYSYADARHIPALFKHHINVSLGFKISKIIKKTQKNTFCCDSPFSPCGRIASTARQAEFTVISPSFFTKISGSLCPLRFQSETN